MDNKSARESQESSSASFNPLTTNVFHRLERSQLISIANLLTSFYAMGNTNR